MKEPASPDQGKPHPQQNQGVKETNVQEQKPGTPAQKRQDRNLNEEQNRIFHNEDHRGDD